MTAIRATFLLLLALMSAPAALPAAPAPLAKASRGVSPTNEQLAAELRLRGFDLYTLKPVANDEWELTTYVVISDGNWESRIPVTRRVKADGRRAAMVAFLREGDESRESLYVR